MLPMKKMARALASCLVAVSAILALAQSAIVPAAAQRPDQGPSVRTNPGSPQLRGGVPGRFDYYSLVLSWSPSFCADNARAEGDPQCSRTSGRPYSFVLHGLWPQYERGYPDSCPTSDSFVPNGTIDRMLDIMPSKRLVIHEYKKHGTCSGLSPDAYYDLARKLHEKVKIPARFAAPTTNQFVDTNQVIGEFVAANPGLRPDMLGVACGGSGNRLREVRVCMSREGEFRACGSNENQRKLCGSPRVFVPPVRASASTGGILGGILGKRAPAAPAAPVAPGQRSL
jgi:ribonuclease T2